MNKKITKLFISQVGDHTNRRFRVYFKPDKDREKFLVGMNFKVSSVNRQTGEVQFSIEYDFSELPKENNDE